MKQLIPNRSLEKILSFSNDRFGINQDESKPDNNNLSSVHGTGLFRPH